MRLGFFVHEILEIITMFMQKNSKIIPKIHMDKMQEPLKELNDYKKSVNTCYKELKKLKEALDTKARLAKEKDPKVNHKNIQNLREDIEETLHHDGIPLGYPYEQY